MILGKKPLSTPLGTHTGVLHREDGLLTLMGVDDVYRLLHVPISQLEPSSTFNLSESASSTTCQYKR